MKVALFIPCYINDFYPKAAMSTLEILEDAGCEITYPENQTCCGQPFLNNGMLDEAKKLAEGFVDKFSGYDYVVSPGSSCISAVRHRYDSVTDDPRYKALKPKVFELCEFLHDVIGIKNIKFEKAYRGWVGLHNSCHGLRELELASPSELNIPQFSKIKAVLSRAEGLEVLEPTRDECCGFGGTFSVGEEAVSAMMGRDRIADHLQNGVDIMTGVDLSCLMHMEGLAKRDGTPMRFVHIAQILTGDL